MTRLPSGGYSPVLTVVILVGLGSAGTAFGGMVLGTRELADTDQGLDGGVPGAVVLFARRQASVLRPADLSRRQP